MMGAGMARWLAGSRWSTRPNLRWSRRSRAWGCWHRARRRVLSGSPAGSRPTSGGSSWRAGRSASSARWRSSGSPPTGARRSSATPTRPPGCATPRRSCRMRCRACSARTARRACWSWPICRMGSIAAGRLICSPAAPSPRWPRRSAKAWRKFTPGRRTRPRLPQRSRPIGSSTTSASSPISRRPHGRIPIAPRRSTAWSRSPPPPGPRWCTAMSAPRTSWWGRRGRSFSMPSAPGMAIRRSIWRSASTTCC